MAISPNTDFVSGQILTATQQNQFPRGVVALTQKTTSNAVTGEAVQITGSSFTAVANRYYKITYFEPNLVGGSGYWTFRIRQTNIAGTTLNTSYNTTGAGIDRQAMMIWVGTFSAGAVNVVATAEESGAGANLNRFSSIVAYLLVEDIGPA